jgi:hypothetical protein
MLMPQPILVKWGNNRLVSRLGRGVSFLVGDYGIEIRCDGVGLGWLKCLK